MKNKYPLPLPNPFMVYPAVKVWNENQYETIVNSHNSPHNVANAPKKDKSGRILDEEFPVYIQLCWLPWCGNFVRSYSKNTPHRNYIEYDAVPKI